MMDVLFGLMDGEAVVGVKNKKKNPLQNTNMMDRFSQNPYVKLIPGVTLKFLELCVNQCRIV